MAARSTSTASWWRTSTEHPAFRNSIKSAAAPLRFSGAPENIELMTFSPDGSSRRINRAWQMPRSHSDMVHRRKALQAWAALSCGFIGRSPDHVASTLVGQRIGLRRVPETWPATGQSTRRLFREASRNDYFLTYVIINPQAERSKDWGDQAEDLVARIVDEDAAGNYRNPQAQAPPPARSWATSARRHLHLAGDGALLLPACAAMNSAASSSDAGYRSSA